KSSRRLLAEVKAEAVDGYWGDNWVSQTLVVKLKDSPGGEHIHWTGIAAAPMELSVAVQGKPIGVFPLQGGQADDIRFHLEPGEEREVVLKFSKHTVDRAGRK